MRDVRHLRSSQSLVIFMDQLSSAIYLYRTEYRRLSYRRTAGIVCDKILKRMIANRSGNTKQHNKECLRAQSETPNDTIIYYV